MYCHSIHNKHNVHQLILKQINKAFEVLPNIASTIHGQRKIHQGCFGRRTALFPSAKCGGAMPLESRLELAHAISLESNPNVRSFRTQALKIPLSLNNFCIPDFLIRTINNKYEIHEVKPSIVHLSEEDRLRFTQVAELLSTIDINFKLIDQSSLPTIKQQQQLMHWYQRGHSQQWSPREIELAVKALAHENFDVIENIFNVLKNEGLKPELADYLLFYGVITLPTYQKPQHAGVI